MTYHTVRSKHRRRQRFFKVNSCAAPIARVYGLLASVAGPPRSVLGAHVASIDEEASKGSRAMGIVECELEGPVRKIRCDVF